MRDLIIVGAGPVGIYAAFYAGLREINTLIIDSQNRPGGQLSALYGDKYIHDIPGKSKVKAKEFIQELIEQMSQYNEFIEEHYDEELIGVIQNEDSSLKVTTNKGEYTTKYLVIATGNGAFTPRKIGLENEEQFKNINYSVQDINDFKGKDVVILGGGDSAVDWALMMEDIANSVTLVHRREEFRAKESSVEKVNNSTVEVLTNYKVTELVGNGDTLTDIRLCHNENQRCITIGTNAVLVNYGLKSKVSGFGDIDVEVTNKGLIVDELSKTGCVNVYAIGNASHFEGKQKLITVGLGEVPSVISDIKGRLDVTTKGKAFYSTNVKK